MPTNWPVQLLVSKTEPIHTFVKLPELPEQIGAHSSANLMVVKRVVKVIRITKYYLPVRNKPLLVGLSDSLAWAIQSIIHSFVKQSMKFENHALLTLTSLFLHWASIGYRDSLHVIHHFNQKLPSLLKQHEKKSLKSNLSSGLTNSNMLLNNMIFVKRIFITWIRQVNALLLHDLN